MSEDKQTTFSAIYMDLHFLKLCIAKDQPKEHLIDLIDKIMNDFGSSKKQYPPADAFDLARDLYQAKCEEWLSDKGEA